MLEEKRAKKYMYIKKKKKRKVWNAHHHIQLDIRNFLLTSILLSSDPALLRRPRLPAQDMQQQRLETATRPQSCGPAQPRSCRASRDSNSAPAWLLRASVAIWRLVVVVVGNRLAQAGCDFWRFAQFLNTCVWAAGFSAVVVMLSSDNFKWFGFLVWFLFL